MKDAHDRPVWLRLSSGDRDGKAAFRYFLAAGPGWEYRQRDFGIDARLPARQRCALCFVFFFDHFSDTSSYWQQSVHTYLTTMQLPVSVSHTAF